jgi:hypothetical protein
MVGNDDVNPPTLFDVSYLLPLTFGRRLLMRRLLVGKFADLDRRLAVEAGPEDEALCRLFVQAFGSPERRTSSPEPSYRLELELRPHLRQELTPQMRLQAEATMRAFSCVKRYGAIGPDREAHPFDAPPSVLMRAGNCTALASTLQWMGYDET